MRTAWFVSIVGWAIAGTAAGAPVQPAHVPAGAVWVAHLDMARLAQTPLGDLLRRRVSEPPWIGQVEAVVSRWAFDPRMDLEGLTAFGWGLGAADAVCLVYGRFEPAAMFGLRRVFPLITEGSATLERVGGRFFGLLAETNLMVVSRTADRISGARAVLEGRSAAVPAAAVGAAPERDVFFSAWITNSTEATVPAGAAVFQRTSRLDLQFASRGRWLDGRMVLSAADDDAAEEVRQVLAGMAGAMLLQAEPGSDEETVLSRVRVGRAGADVSVDVRVPLALAEKHLTASLLHVAAAEIPPRR